MTEKVLADVLANEGRALKQDAAYVIPPETQATVYVNLGTEALVIERIKALKLGDIVVAETTRGERYALAYEDVRAVRFSERAGYSAGY